jgi:hypothetical protein
MEELVMKETKSKMPDHILKHQPKREDFQTQEEYEEAKAYFRHRFRPALQSHSRASQPK